MSLSKLIKGCKNAKYYFDAVFSYFLIVLPKLQLSSCYMKISLPSAIYINKLIHAKMLNFNNLIHVTKMIIKSFKINDKRTIYGKEFNFKILIINSCNTQ